MDEPNIFNEGYSDYITLISKLVYLTVIEKTCFIKVNNIYCISDY